MSTRNDRLVLADRTRKNLEYVARAYKSDATAGTVHIVTQIFNSLLGLIVLPRQEGLVEPVDSVNLVDLHEQGLPQWTITLDSNPKTTTLGQLTKHLRNAIAHGLVQFSSDSHDPQLVTITVEDRINGKHPANWRANIRASELHNYCLRFVELLQSLD